MIKKLVITAYILCAYTTHVFASDSAHGADAHGASSGGLPQLDPSTYASQTFWLIIVFAFMYIFFSFKSLPAISSTIESRSDRVQNDLNTAERLQDEVTSVQDSYESALDKARQKSSDLFRDVEMSIKNKSDAHAAEFAEKTAEQMAKIEKKIKTARKKAMEQMEKIAADVATNAAEKIIGVRTDEKSASDVVKSLNKAA